MFMRRSYTDGPTESQKLYGSHLPPSLRWGAARKYGSGRDDLSRPPRAHPAAFPVAPPLAYRAAVPNDSLANHDFENRHRDIRRSNRIQTDLAEELAEMRMERRSRSRSRDRRNARLSKSDTDTSVVAGAKDSDDSVSDDGFEPNTAAGASQTWETFSCNDYDEWSTHPRRPADRKNHSESKDRPPRRERLRRDLTDPPEYLQGYTSHRSRANSPRTESTDSHRTSAPRASTPWFLESWNVRAARGLNAQDIGSKQTSSASPTIVTELSSESIPCIEAEPTATSAAYEIRPWAYGRSVPSIKPILKRVVHATYGDLLQSEAPKGLNPPGFVAVSQQCGSQGDTLYHIL